jgi:hypothetical protein
MQTFVQLGSKKWFISLIFASAFISLFSSRSTILQPKIAKPQIVGNKKVQNVLQSIKYRVGMSSRLACIQKKQHHTLYSSSN